MRVAVLGDGLLGRSIFDVLAPRERELGEPPAVVMYSHDDLDVTSLDSIVAAFKWFKPDVAINTVAYHRLLDCERNPDMAWNVNAKGAGRVAQLVPTVYVSTDYVFTGVGPHEEAMPGSRPLSEYGRSKLAGELETLEHNGIVVRVSALFGHHQSHKGPTFPETVLSGFDPLKLPTDQRFAPTYAPDAAERIVALALGLLESHIPFNPFVPPIEGIYHAANRGSTTWAEYAEHILAVTGHKRHVLPYKAHDSLRPTDSWLKSKRLPQMRHWAQALSEWAMKEGRLPVVSPLR